MNPDQPKPVRGLITTRTHAAEDLRDYLERADPPFEPGDQLIIRFAEAMEQAEAKPAA